MSEKVQSPAVLSFKRLDYVFWAVWACMPLLFYKLWKLVNDPSVYTQGLTPEQVACMTDIANPEKFSSAGLFLYNLPLLGSLIFYTILIFSFHRMVRRFADGGAFDSHTLSNMKTLGYTLIGYPFVDFAIGHLVSAGLIYNGDLKVSNGPAFIDIGVIAAGFFIIALMIVLKNAIDIKSENDLTI